MRVRNRSSRDMFLLGGWLFADLLLGLAMLFFTANTFGAPDPTPAPPATPDLLATAQARADLTSTAQAVALTNAQLTATAQAASLAGAELTATASARDAAAAATATAIAMLTREAMSAEERATADAKMTQEALAAEATIAAFATEQARNQEEIDEQTRKLATAAALATEASLAARLTMEAAAQQNQDLAFDATAAAMTATAAAGDANAAAKTATASSKQARATIRAAQKTTTALAGIAYSNVLEPTATELEVTVPARGLIAGTAAAEAETVRILGNALEPYLDCRVGFTLTSASGTFEEGIEVSRRINDILKTYFADQFGESAMESFSTLRANDLGEVTITIFFFRGCTNQNTPAAVVSPPLAVLPDRSD